jgi:deoxycytidylate deaminase
MIREAFAGGDWVSKLVLGLTGSFGSGCTTIAEKFIKPRGYKYISLSELLKDNYRNETGKTDGFMRHELQKFGNELREQRGGGYLAEQANSLMEKDYGQTKWVIDSIRNPMELEVFRKKYPNFFLIGVFAEQDVRWERLKSNYNQDRRQFEQDDERDKGEDVTYGQRVAECFLGADLVISNNKTCYPESDDERDLKTKVLEYIQLIEKPYTRHPTEKEAVMAIAYANGLRSSCLKRKVGAVIIDDYGQLFSSGYNEVPSSQRTCKQAYGRCYRDMVKEGLGDEIIKVAEERLIAGFKILDYCRALHAEENAILNVARFGSSVALRGATLYTTTYPCNLCANKIVQVGIKKVVYFEPYPMKEASETLRNNSVLVEPFEGVTFKGYFRLYGGV